MLEKYRDQLRLFSYSYLSDIIFILNFDVYHKNDIFTNIKNNR